MPRRKPIQDLESGLIWRSGCISGEEKKHWISGKYQRMNGTAVSLSLVEQNSGIAQMTTELPADGTFRFHVPAGRYFLCMEEGELASTTDAFDC
ncbi:MAG: hypothetical protein O2800_01030 [Planctomycetota bacterium]|nr:hypothetical protein [Planctomycetota bacterium]